MAKPKRQSLGPDFALERALIARHGGLVAGIDEAGRGPWAGPVVAAAVILDPETIPQGLNDSKRLGEAARERLYEEITRDHTVGVGLGSVARIDRDNILQATLWGMREALLQLGERPNAALIDGNRAPELPCAAQTVIRGDAKSLTVAAASIVAKVTRDRLMAELAARHPGYGWERNKGYGTKEHAAALFRQGITPHHRRSFKPIAEILEKAAA